MLKLAPSILAADFKILGEQISIVEEAGAEYLHIDVMDGVFVPSISFGMPVIASIRNQTKLIFDVHLMVEDPIKFIKDFKDAGADIITIHAEACKNIHETIVQIKELGMKVGVSLNPLTPLDVLDEVIKDIDMVLLMSVQPGYGGQSFIPSTIAKIMELKDKIDQAGYSIDIEVDGGINSSNVYEILKAGANVIVSGTSIFEGNIKENIAKFKKEFVFFSRSTKLVSK